MDDLKLRTYDGIAIAGFLMLPPLFSTGLSKLVKENSTAAWFALLIAFGVMICLFLLLTCLMRRYEGKNIIEITSMVMGRAFGVLYAVALGAYFCFFTGINIRESAEILKIYGMSLTPLFAVAGLILLAAVIMNFFGGRPIVKSAGLFFILMAFCIVFIMLLGLNRYNPDKLVPLLGNGISETAGNGLFTSSLFDGVIVLFLFAPAFSNISKMKMSGILALTFCACAYVLLCLCFIMMFSPSIGAKLISGIIEMGKSSYFNHFFYRFESFLLPVLILSSAIQASLCIFIARKSLACAFKLQSFKAITVLCATAVLVAIFLPSNMLDLTQGYLPVIRQYSVFFMAGFPLLVLVISLARGVLKIDKENSI